jgi:mannose-1-phosphate guanylyltransferase
MASASTTNDGTGATPSRTGAGICIIMAGGRGTRFWPLSRTDRPKQMQALSGPRSLLRDTYDRVAPLVGPERVLVITSSNLAEATRQDLPEIPRENIIGEPVGRNTAPCAVLGMGLAAAIDAAAPVALLPADHFIPDEDEFRRQLQQAFERAARAEVVVTLGIPATRPETGYGYLHAAVDREKAPFLSGLSFVEKPDPATAEGYVRDGNYFWNGGIFVWNAGFFQAMAARHVADVCTLLDPAIKSFGTPEFAGALETAYETCPSDSIDYAVMEKLGGYEILPASFRWSDLGSWDAWGELAPDLGEENRGSAEILSLDSTGNIVKVPSGRLLALVGIRDLIIVDTPDALLVCQKADAQRIKEIIQRLEKDGRAELL